MRFVVISPIKRWYNVLMPNVTYTIGQLAKEVELPMSTIRFYERKGLLQSTARSGGNYRLYDDRTADRIRFIRSAQFVGFKLDDIQMILSFENGSACPCGDVRAILEGRLKEVKDQLKELRRVRKSLEEAISICDQSDANRACRVIGNISSDTSKKLGTNDTIRR